VVIVDLQNQPLFEDLLEYLLGTVECVFIRPDSGKARDLPEMRAIGEGLVASPFHGLVKIAAEH